MENTKYRTVHNGHWEELQYFKTVRYKFLCFRWTKRIWKYVPTPYYDSIYGRNDDNRCFVNSLYHNPESFVKNNPNIEPYLEKTYEIIDAARKKRTEEYKIVEENRGKIKNL